jgi:sugar lactone lactonase YvrE
MRTLIRVFAALIVLLLALVVFVRVYFGTGERLADRTGAPRLEAGILETVADLEYPPGNIAVSASGRVFVTLHPDGKPPIKVVEIVDGKPVPYPNEEFQLRSDTDAFFDTVLSLRVDRQNRLWTLDFADFGRGTPRLLAFDLDTDEVVHEYEFPRDVAGLGSMLNDFQVSPDGRTIYIAETSPLVHHPALIVYDTTTFSSRRVLDRHPSVLPENYIIQAPGRDMRIYGLAVMRIGVDSIALDRSGEWLYYGPVTGDRMYRIRSADLRDPALDDAAIGAKVEDYAAKTLSDGITTDVAGNVYLSDMENSAVVLLKPDRTLETLVKDPRLRWPDGFSFGPDDWLYVTCSSLHHVLFVSQDVMRAHAPYQVYRFKPGAKGVPGH